jgi:hypothetical protein
LRAAIGAFAGATGGSAAPGGSGWTTGALAGAMGLCPGGGGATVVVIVVVVVVVVDVVLVVPAGRTGWKVVASEATGGAACVAEPGCDAGAACGVCPGTSATPCAAA